MSFEDAGHRSSKRTIAAGPQRCNAAALNGCFGVSADRFAIEILLFDGFYLSELAAVSEAARCLGALMRRSAPCLRILTPDGARVHCECGSVAVRGKTPALDRAAGLFVIAGGGAKAQQAAGLAVLAHRAQAAGRYLVVLSDAVGVLVRRGFFGCTQVVMPWDDPLPETDPTVEGVRKDNIYRIGDRVSTCAGRMATLDLMITLLSDTFGPTVRTLLSDRLKHGQVRSSRAFQRQCARDRFGIESPKLLQAVQIMEQTVAKPVSMRAIAGRLSVSVRHLERLFKRELHRPPHEFYMRMRLRKARWLVENTGLPLTDVAMCCGFSGLPVFTRAFIRYVGERPSALRRRLAERRSAHPFLSFAD